MLKGEKKTLVVLLSSLNFVNKANEKVVLALDRGDGEAIVSIKKEGLVVTLIIRATFNKILF